MKFKLRIAGIAALLFIAAASYCASATEPVCAKHPCLFMTPAAVDAFKNNYKNWPGADFDSFRKANDGYRMKGIDVPALGGEYTQRYICPIHGTYLRFDPFEPKKHYCEKCGKYYEGEPYDSCWREFKHIMNIESAMNAGFIYQITGEKEYAEWARGMLLKYAENYKKYPAHGGPAGLGRLTSQSLDEAVWLLSAAAAYDYVADSPVMSEDDRNTIRKKLFIPIVQHLDLFPFGIHNIQVWESTASLAAGILTGKKNIINSASATLRDEIAKGITPDGLWYETSVGYHIYAMKPFAMLAVMCKNAGLDLCDNPKFGKIFTVLPKLLTPDGRRLPSINDYRHDVFIDETFPGMVAARYTLGDTSLDRLIASIAARTSQYDLIRQIPYLASVAPEEMRKEIEAYRQPGGGQPTAPADSSNMPQSGLTVLRRNGLYALIKYQPLSGGHDHLDRPEIVFFDHEREIYPDLGTVPYGHPLYRAYYRRTEAHNIVMVDGRQVAQNACENIQFEDTEDFTGVVVDCRELYDGVVIRRTIALTDTFFADVTVAESDKEHFYDWMLKINVATETFKIPGEDTWIAPVSVPSNPEISFNKTINLKSPIDFTFGGDSGRPLGLTLLPDGDSKLNTGTATGFRPNEKMPVLMWEKHGKKAIFAAVTGSKAEKIKIETDKNTISIITSTGKRLLINLETGKIKAE